MRNVGGIKMIKSIFYLVCLCGIVKVGKSEALTNQEVMQWVSAIDDTTTQQYIDEGLDKGIHIDAENEGGHTVLMKAVVSGNGPLVSYVLSCQANTNARDKAGQTAVLHAVKSGNLEIVALLLSYSADIDIPDYFGRTPLHWSVILLHPPTITQQLILRHKPKINTVNYFGFTPFINVVDFKNLNLVHFLVEHGADVNYPKKNRTTPLMCAILNDSLNIVQFLLTVPGIDLNARDYYGYTALMQAVNVKNFEMVKLLLQRPGVDVRTACNGGETAVSIASRPNGSLEILQELRFYPNKFFLTFLSSAGFQGPQAPQAPVDLGHFPKKAHTRKALENSDLMRYVCEFL